MNLGWIDFSDTDRKRTMDVLRLFQEQGAVDELGIGVIRDGFANYFFPGTSTIQTRAKYFFIIPYAMMETVADPRVTTVQGALRRLDEIERECAIILKQNSGTLGVIGATILPKWVTRTPSTIYWNGLRTLGIFNGGMLHNMTISEYFRLALKLRDEKKSSAYGNRKEDADENERDDIDAGDFRYQNFWNLTPPQKDWKEHLTIKLTPFESDYLATKIKTTQPTSVFAYILKEGIDIEQYEDFPSFSYDIKPAIDEENKQMLELADRFNNFISVAQVLYNLIFSDNKNEVAISRWDELKDKAFSFAADIDLDAIFSLLRLNNYGLKEFLKKFKNATLAGEWDVAKDEIIKQEVRIKGARAKLKNKSRHSLENWIGGYRLDYRFADAKRLIRDIRNGVSHV